jgi:hypothetical protein
MPASRLSRLLAISALLGLLLGARCPAGDADAWRARGFTVTEKGGAITGLSGPTKGFGADDFRALAAVATLTSLSLDGAGGALTDDAMRQLAGLGGLRELSFNSCSLSDDGLRLLAGLHGLRSLSLFHPSRGRADFTGAGLAALAELPEFERLTLAGSTAGDAALAAIATLPHLRELRLWHNTETAAGLAKLAGLASLRKLTLGQRLAGKERPPASLGDAALTALARLPALEELSLSDARLGLDALLTLKDLSKLKKLTVAQVDTPAADVERLRAALPGVAIDWKPLTPEQAQALVDKLKL